MQIKVIYHDDTIDTVDPAILDNLLSSNRIKKFLRSDGWATVGVDSLRRVCPYNGPERRKAFGRPVKESTTCEEAEYSLDVAKRKWDEGEAKDSELVRLSLQRIVELEKKAEEQIKTWESDGRLAAIVKYCDDAVIGNDLQGVITSWNKGAEKISGYTAAEVVGQHVSMLLPKSLTDAVPQILEKIRKGESVERYEMAAVRKDGRQIYVSLMISPVKDSSGNIVGASTIARDITCRRAEEETIKEREERFSAIFESAYSGIALTDQEGKIIFANQRMADVFGWTIDELIGTDYLDHIHESEKIVADKNERLVISGEVDCINTARHYIRKDGSDFWGYISGRRLQHPGGRLYGLVGIITDITGHKQCEDEQLKIKNLESISILAGGIAHDFNNLLQAIIGNISLAKMYASPGDKIYARLSDAEIAVEKARELSYRLLTFAKGGEPVKRVYSMSGLIERTVGSALRGSNVNIAFDIPPDLSPVEIDMEQIKQVFTSLTINAREAMPEGGVLRVYTENVSVPAGGNETLGLEEGDYIMIAFEDQGTGIQEQNLHRIFDPYFTTKGVGAEKGKGMGLAVCHSIIKKHRGAITCKSKEKLGTTIKIYLPASGKKQGEGMLVEKGLAAGTGKILIMDDERHIRGVVGDMLAQFGYEVELAQNGEEALDLYKKALEKARPFAAVILDLTVKNGMGGEAALMKLKEIDPNIKAIVSSGHTDAPIMKNFRKYGFINAIAKPYRINQLHELLTRMLRADQ
jgi:PAS domain S-box-containing protein